MLKKGSTKARQVIRFFELLHNRLEDLFGIEYIKHTVFVMDNAKVHTAKLAKKYFELKQLSILTLPPYTPEMNKVEKTFLYLKMKLKKKCLFNKRLEYIVIQAMMDL
jgi:transposase